jgi:hypothetical protein
MACVVAASRPGSSGSTLNYAVLTLTVIGVVGTWVDFLALFMAGGRGLTGGCGGLAGLVLLFMFIMAVLLMAIALLAAAGLALLWLRPTIGPAVLIAANLLAMGFYGWWVPISAGQEAWGILLLSLAAAPAVAIALLVRPLASRGGRSARIIKVVVLALLAAPMLWFYASGTANEASLAFASPPLGTVMLVGGCGATAN